jgi:hypothetical protein
LLNNMPFELYKYVIDKELQHTGGYIPCVTPVAYSFVVDKIGQFVSQNQKIVNMF